MEIKISEKEEPELICLNALPVGHWATCGDRLDVETLVYKKDRGSYIYFSADDTLPNWSTSVDPEMEWEDLGVRKMLAISIE